MKGRIWSNKDIFLSLGSMIRRLRKENKPKFEGTEEKVVRSREIMIFGSAKI